MDDLRQPTLGDWRAIPGTDAIEVWDGRSWVDPSSRPIYRVQTGHAVIRSTGGDAGLQITATDPR